MVKTEVTIKLSASEYRFLRMEVVYLRDSLQKEYNTNAKNWGDQNPDRIAFWQRIVNLGELLESL